jgi:flagellar biogenesis protein FliO
MQDTASSAAPGAGTLPDQTIEQVTLAPAQMGGRTDMASGLLSTALALAFVLVLAWLVLRTIKRFQQGKTAFGQTAVQVPEILHSLSLGPNQRLVTIHYAGRQYLLGVTAAAIQLLDTGHDQTATAETPPENR